MLMFLRVMIVMFGLAAAFASPQVVALDMGMDTGMIEPQELKKELASDKNLFLLDVREPSEYEAAHIKGATLIPLNTLPSHLSDIPKDRRVVVYCRSGHRSARAVDFLRQSGFHNVLNLAGGINAWSQVCTAGSKDC